MQSVDRKVLLLTTLCTFGIIVLGIAGVVTPLGLDEGVVATSTKNLSFQYFRDTSAIGQATVNRDDYTYSRLCNTHINIVCPSQEIPKGAVWDPMTLDFGLEEENQDIEVSSKIPKNLTDAFKVPRSLSPHNTIAGPFDVQYRAYSFVRSGVTVHNPIDNNQPYVVGVLKTYGVNILQDDYKVVEGGIVDPINGGYGFYNHSIPKGITHRAEWDTDLLWMEPESKCVDNNFSIVYTIGWEGDGMPVKEASIRDYGGLKDIPPEAPYIDLNRTQTAPMLQARAWKAALIMNLNMVVSLNISYKTMPKSDQTHSYNITSFLSEAFSFDPFTPYVEQLHLVNGFLPMLNLENINKSVALEGIGSKYPKISARLIWY
jgi:hypothetical protein